MMRKFLSCFLTLIIFVSFIIGLFVVGQPYLVQKEYDRNVQNNVSAFREMVLQVEENDLQEETLPVIDSGQPVDVLPELREYMEQYNQEIYLSGQSDLTDAWAYEEEILDPTAFGLESDVIGVVSIPALGLEHPLRIGANYSNLDQGFAVLSQTSMPIGGENTNCVIAGHRGWHNSQYLRDIEKLKIGDKIYIENPWETLEYEVCEIRIVLPSESENIFIQEGKDLITLVTCHPYLVGTYRYLVYAERVTYKAPATTPMETSTAAEPITPSMVSSPIITTTDGSTFESSEQTIWTDLYLPWICLLLLFLLFVCSFICTIRVLRRDRHKKVSAT